jgi:hypothetical protein
MEKATLIRRQAEGLPEQVEQEIVRPGCALASLLAVRTRPGAAEAVGEGKAAGPEGTPGAKVKPEGLAQDGGSVVGPVGGEE